MFYMLVVIVGWLLFRRLVYGFFMYLIWWFLRFLFGIGSMVVLVMVGKGGEKLEVVMEEGRVKVDGILGEDLLIVKVGGDEGEKVVGGE